MYDMEAMLIRMAALTCCDVPAIEVNEPQNEAIEVNESQNDLVALIT
jgi:hypothetical protein